MSHLKKILFISDVHLEEKCKDSHQNFLKLMQAIDSTSIDSLYILGDLFEFWIADDFNPFNQSVMTAIKEVSERGVPVYFVQGNRDFLLDQQFLKAAGCTLIADETVISIFGTRVLLMHGDMLCVDDLNYLRARKILRNRCFQWAFLRLPLRLRLSIAERLREKSKQHTQSVAPQIMDANQAAIESVMKKHNVNTLIHGHTHRPNIHEFLLERQQAKRIVLGAWHTQANVFIWQQDGQQKLIDFKQDEIKKIIGG